MLKGLINEDAYAERQKYGLDFANDSLEGQTYIVRQYTKNNNVWSVKSGVSILSIVIGHSLGNG